MRIMAIDFGEERIGIAMTDLLKMIASPYDIYYRKHTDEDIEYFLELIKKQQVDTIVSGYPLNMEGQEQEITQKVKAFAEELSEKSNCKLIYVDERMSSVIAEDILKKTEKDWKKRKKVLDKYAAMVILQDYLDMI